MVEGIAIEGIAAHQLAAANAGSGGGQVDLAVEPLQRPSAAHDAEFARAASGAVPHDVQAPPPSSMDGMTGRISRQADALMSQLKMTEAPATSPGAASGTPGQQTAGFDKDQMASAVSRMEKAYMFAIETTMASRGSTEATKIFNTLLKGQ